MGQKIQATLLFLFLCGFAACAGTTNGALPQSSLPPAQNCSGGGGCISVTGADSRGYVTVTGSASAVPNSTVVILSVSSSTSLNLNSFTDAFIATAQAQATSCTSDLPTCTDTLEASSCQLTSETDGSFSGLIQASNGETISVTYLDVDKNCKESPAYTKEVKKSVLLLYQNAISMAHKDSSTLYVIGTQNVSSTIVDEVSVSENVDGDIDLDPIQTLTTTGLTGTPNFFGIVKDVNSLQEYFVLTADDAFLGEELSTNISLSAVDDSIGGPFFNAAVQKEFPTPYDASITCIPGTPDPTGLTSSRIFVSHSTTWFQTESNSSIPLSVIIPGDTPFIHTLEFDYSAMYPDLDGFFLTNVDNIIISENNKRGFFIGIFRDNANNTASYLIEIPVADINYVCGNSPITTGMVIPLTETLDAEANPIILSIFGDDIGDLTTHDIILLPNPNSQKIYKIDLTDGSAEELRDFSTEDEGLKILIPLDLPVSTTSHYAGYNNQSFLRKYSYSHNTGDLSSTQSIFVALHPLRFSFFTDTNFDDALSLDDLSTLDISFKNDSQIFILDGGISEVDDFTQISVYKLSDIE